MGRLHQRMFEGGCVECQQRLRALVGQRPDQRVRPFRCRCVERQQRQHVWRAKPLPRDALVRPDLGGRLIEMVVYVGLPPAMPEWQTEREKKNKFVFWLRSNGFMVVAKDGSPADESHYKANVDVLMAIDALELSAEMRPDVVVLVTGDADFAHLALQFRRKGIRVEVASIPQNLGSALKTAANEIVDLTSVFEGFDPAPKSLG